MSCVRFFILLIAFILSTAALAFYDSDLKSFSLENISQKLVDTVIRDAQKLNHSPQDHETALRKIIDLSTMLEKNLARPFNFSLCQFDKSSYLLAVRFAWVNRKYEEKLIARHIIPGNDNASQFEKGENFWWQNWMSRKFDMGTMYFLVDENFDAFELLFPRLAKDIPEHELEYRSHSIQPVQIPDVRIFKQDDVFYVSFLGFNFGKSFYEASVIHEEKSPLKIIEFDKPFYDKNFIENINTGLMVMNLSPIKVDPINRSVFYLNWVDNKMGVKFGTFFEQTQETREQFIPFHDLNYVVSGQGSTEQSPQDIGMNHGLMPLFSFGTPLVEIDNKLLGLGHVKIENNCEEHSYKHGSNIDKFRSFINTSFAQNNHVRCDALYDYQGVIKRKTQLYLMYFFVVDTDEDGNPVSMHISDSYLPVPKNPKDENYIFSLVFPMGITRSLKDKNNLLVSAGYGDYESLLMSVSVEEFVDACKYDIQSLDFNAYEYKILQSY